MLPNYVPALLVSLVLARLATATLGPYCNGNTTVHCVYAPIQAALIGSAILSFTTGSLVAFGRDRAGGNTWVVSNEAVVNLTFRCLDAPHSETWVIGLGRNGGSAAGPATSGSGYVYFNDGGKKAYHNKDIESHTPGVDAVGGCGGALRFARA